MLRCRSDEGHYSSTCRGLPSERRFCADRDSLAARGSLRGHPRRIRENAGTALHKASSFKISNLATKDNFRAPMGDYVTRDIYIYFRGCSALCLTEEFL